MRGRTKHKSFKFKRPYTLFWEVDGEEFKRFKSYEDAIKYLVIEGFYYASKVGNTELWIRDNMWVTDDVYLTPMFIPGAKYYLVKER